MSASDYILLAITLFIGFTSMVISSRKSGYIVGYRLSFRDKYTINKDALGNYCRILLPIVAGCFIVGSLLSQDMLTVLVFTGMNTFFIGYVLAWKKVIDRRE